MRIGITGHRPNRMYGYDLTDSRWETLKNQLKEFLIQNNCSIALSGMALGVDMIFAQAVIDLKEQGHDIKLHCVLPCIDQDCMWSKQGKELYKNMLDKADKVKYISKYVYRPNCMQKRNEYIVDHCDLLMAVWDEIKSGGTYRCIQYAYETGKEILIISPANIKK